MIVIDLIILFNVSCNTKLTNHKHFIAIQVVKTFIYPYNFANIYLYGL